MTDQNFKYSRYLMFDDPIPYKELLIYPVKIKDYMDFMYVAECLLLEKNSIKDPMLALKAISMTYLEYMFSISSEDKTMIQFFVALMAIVLHKKEDDNFSINFYQENGKPFFEIMGNKFTSEDFDELRQIISEQNSLALPDETIQKSVRDALDEARRFKQKINKSKSASFEEQMLALSLYTGWDLEKVYDMTIRRFFMSIQRSNHMIMSNIYLTASLSGMVTFKDKSILKGWLADIEEKDKYSDVKMSLESVQKKVSGDEAKESKK